MAVLAQSALGDTIQRQGITVARVPAYSPHAVAEHAVALMLALNRRIPQAWSKTRGGNFSLVGQMGFDMVGKRVGVVGTGLIGSIVARILKLGFQCDVVAHDVHKNTGLEDIGVRYVELDELFRTSDVITRTTTSRGCTRLCSTAPTT
ncbi:unnamed protein product [Prorocentrum cordatum]|uniref:D-isomer specific 2-hydroxyacid dehydrogenase NAD-binding domain-containing protein n=1 Tax=Prorocentrum cordatum TaxID=2364126 RepID=A0ABN9US29_9DINO|nr:unnamed protein product [Polarella glacialis]